MFDFGMGAVGMASLLVSLLTALLFLLVWFVVNRASVRANEQIRLLQEIADQQRRQTELLSALVDHARGKSLADPDSKDPAFNFQDLIPER
ncbi:YebO family protein [Edaphovirga cremea]|uniref:YebO family protein n=1 Tax=Edaphovirga cremea TaxID=2267246 RepID=UPI000DEED1BE|nr:YebO family protein [Edaphovirga cremea]